MSCNNNFDKGQALGSTGILPVSHSANKFVYVNRNMVQNNFQQRNSSASGKILINPNFKQRVHVNPHFNKVAHVAPSTSIFVNPNVIKQKSLLYTMASIPTTYQTSTSNAKSTEVTREACTVLMQNNHKLKEEIKKKGAVIKNTKTKLVRVSSSVSCNKPKESGSNCKTPPTKQRQKICSKYRLVRRSLSKDQPSSDNDGVHIKKVFYVKSRFKIDKIPSECKSYTKYVPQTKEIRKKRFYFFNSLSSENLYVKKKIVLSKTQFVGINRILHRTVLNNKLNNTDGITSQNKRIGRKLITIRGKKFKLDAHNKTLTCLTRQPISARGVVLNLKDKNILIKNNANKRLNLTSYLKQKNVSSLSNRMKKCNIPCPYFRKYGRCRGKEKGTCNRVHNPDQISLCPKFLQGACINDKCLLSHKVSPEKMPTCKFFLEGLCTRENCQYLHVKINAKADICRKFLEGFCDKGRECDKRHQYLCPEFEKLGKCSKKKCPYPHANVVRKRKISIKVATKSSNSQKRIKKDNNYKQTPEYEIKELSESPKKVEIVNNLVKRYYVDSKGTPSKDTDINDDNKTKILHSDTHLNDNIAEESSAPLPKRPKLGALPSFIPFENI